jgi:hypothetical protein
MDGDQFDSIIRLLATRESRRRLLKGLAASASGSVFATIGRRQALAAPDPCSVYCSRQEPKGPAQAACKQACKQCKAETRRVCRQETGYTCCPRGHECPFGSCCPIGRATCFGPAGQPVCCSDPADTTCCQLPSCGQVCPSSIVCGPGEIRQGCDCVCDPPGRARCDNGQGSLVCCSDPDDTFCCFDPGGGGGGGGGGTGGPVCPSTIDCGPNKVLEFCSCVCDPDLPACGDGGFRDPFSCECTTCQQGFICGSNAQVCNPGIGGCFCTAVLEGGAACAANNCLGPCNDTTECEQRHGPGAICQAPGTGCCGQQCLAACPSPSDDVAVERVAGADLNTGGSSRSRQRQRSRKQHISRKQRRRGARHR